MIIMKKLFMLLPLAAFMFTACSSDLSEQTLNESPAPNYPEGAIWFTSGIQDVTRGLTTAANFRAFNVTALHSNHDYAFTNLAVTSTNGTVWTYSTGTTDEYKWWPSDNSDLRFFAYAPTTDDIKNKITINDISQKMTQFKQAQKVVNHIDVLAAAATGNKTNNALSGMTLDFKHALAQIEIKAKNSKSDEYKVEVLGVKLCRINAEGDMTFQTAADDYPTWGNLSTSMDFIKEGAAATAAITLTNSVQSVMFGTDNFLMLPQQLTAWTGSNTDETGAYLSVLCRIWHKVGTEWKIRFPDDQTKFGFSAIPIGTKLEAGHKYTYTLDFFGAGGGAGQVDPEPTNPEKVLEPGDPGYDSTNPVNNNQDENVDPNPGLKDDNGDDVADGDTPGTSVIPEAKSGIRFTVTITDWINGEGDNQVLDL